MAQPFPRIEPALRMPGGFFVCAGKVVQNLQSPQWREETGMEKEFQQAYQVVGRNLKTGLPHAENEYEIFLRHLKLMQPHFLEIGVTFDAHDFATRPESVTLETPFGEIRMRRVFVVDEGHIAVVVVLTDTVGEGSGRTQRDLRAMRLGWNSPWIDSAGKKAEKEFASDETNPRATFELVRNALAQKLEYDTARWSYEGWQGLPL